MVLACPCVRGQQAAVSADVVKAGRAKSRARSSRSDPSKPMAPQIDAALRWTDSLVGSPSPANVRITVLVRDGTSGDDP